MAEERETSINLVDIFKVLLKRWWIIAISSIVCAIAMFGYTKFVTVQRYQSSGKLYVNNKGIDVKITGISSSDLSAQKSLVDTYSVIITTRDFLEDSVLDDPEVESKLSRKYNFDQLKKMISVGAVNSTEIFYITVTATNQNDALVLAKAITSSFDSKVEEIIDGTNAKLVETPVEVKAVSKKYTTKTLVGFLVGFVTSIAIVIIFDLFIDDTLNDVDWLKQTFKEDIPLLTIIPDSNSSSSKHSEYNYYESKNKDNE